MDQKQRRIFSVRLKIVRLYHEALDSGALGAFHPKLFQRLQVVLREQSLVEMRKRHRGSASRRSAIDFRGARSALSRINHRLAIARELDVVQRTRPADDDAARSTSSRNH